MNKFRVIAFCAVVLLVGAIAWASPVPDTGQTKCYNHKDDVITCPSPGEQFYGQDGNYSINPMSYTKLDGNGNALPDSASFWVMVKDNVTGLIWEMKTNKDGKEDYTDPHDADNEYTWYDSNPATNGGEEGGWGDDKNTENFIKALNDAQFGSFNDWRMPTLKELAYIVDYSIPYPGPTINTGYFPNNVSGFYWSSTTFAYITYQASGFSFDYGHDLQNDKNNNYYVRAVRGGQSGAFGDLVIGSFNTSGDDDLGEIASAGSYTDNRDGTVTDVSTGLMWEKNSPTKTMTWEAALAYCEGLSLGGNTDWRLPNKNELRSLADYSRGNPAINWTYFPNTVSSFYWSSTTNANDTYYEWGLNFDYGCDNTTSRGMNSSHYVRAVRGGQYGSLNKLVISPPSRSVSKAADNTTFNVSNSGTGSMSWNSAVVSDSDWLTITSGNSGINAGTITCSYTANTGAASRTATIRVTAPGATGSPVDVSVTQAANTTQCTATINGNLSMHIPLLSHLVPWWGAPSYTVDLAYAYNASYPTMIIFKMTQAALAQSGVYLCDPSTLADDFTIHIPDALLPDGITRMWLDLTYSQALSANGVCFYVSNYGVGSK